MLRVEVERELAEALRRIKALEQALDAFPTRFGLQPGVAGESGGSGGLSGFMVTGGATGEGTRNSGIERSTAVLDVVAESWLLVGDMPKPERLQHTVTGVGNDAFAVGGNNMGGVFPYTDRFNGRFRSWTMLTDLSYPVKRAAAANVDGKVHVCGGGDGATKYPEHFAFDPETETWGEKTLALLVNPDRVLHAATGVGATMHVMGGAGNGRPVWIANHDRYDDATDSWSEALELPSLHSPRQELAATTVDGKVYALGGGDSDPITIYNNQEYTPGGESWVRKNTLNDGRRVLAAGTVGSELVICGGRDRNGETASTRKFNPTTNRWTTMPDLITGPRYSHGGTGI